MIKTAQDRTLLNIVFLNLTFEESHSVAARPTTSKRFLAVDVVRRTMIDHSYGIFDGAVYKKVPLAMFTYLHCSTAKDYLLNMLGSMEIADVIACHISQLTTLLSEPACRIIKPIVVDFNFIEVKPAGYCFNIAEKAFQLNPKDLRWSPKRISFL